MRKLAIPLAISAVLAVPVVLWMQRATYTPAIASREAAIVERVLRLEFSIAGAIFALCMTFFVYSLIVFRRRPGDTGDGQYFHGHTAVEIGWTAVPAAIVLGLGVLGMTELRAMDSVFVEPRSDDLVVEVTGMQWAWSFEYAESGVVSDRLVVPTGRPVYLNLHATDVIHSFFVPEMRLKMDAIPGKTNSLRLVPDVPGAYKLRCAELCGTRHADMVADVEVVTEAEFAAWIESESAILDAPPEERGAAWARKHGCIGCHSADGSQLVGPTWKGLFGAPRTLADGSEVIADEEYLRTSMLQPNAAVVEGYAEGLMPLDYGQRVSDQELEDIIAYIASLR